MSTSSYLKSDLEQAEGFQSEEMPVFDGVAPGEQQVYDALVQEAGEQQVYDALVREAGEQQVYGALVREAGEQQVYGALVREAMCVHVT